MINDMPRITKQQISRKVSTKPLNRGLNYSITFNFRWLEAIIQISKIRHCNLKRIKKRLKLLCRYPSHSKIYGLYTEIKILMMIFPVLLWMEDDGWEILHHQKDGWNPINRYK